MNHTHHSVSTLKILSREEKKEVYTIGYQLYQERKYQEALELFRLIYSQEPNNTTFYEAVTTCEKVLKEYTKALKYYGLASLLDPSNLAYPLAIAECQLRLGETSQAIKTLMNLSEIALDTTPEPTELLYQIEALLAECRKSLH